MKRKLLCVIGSVLFWGTVCAVMFLSTDIRILPEVRSSYEIQTTQTENSDMALLLQMLNGNGQ